MHGIRMGQSYKNITSITFIKKSSRSCNRPAVRIKGEKGKNEGENKVLKKNKKQNEKRLYNLEKIANLRVEQKVGS